VNEGTNSAIFTSSTLANNAAVTCVLTSNATCASVTTATSNVIVEVVNEVPIADAGIDQNIANNVIFNLDGNTPQLGETGLWTTTSAATIALPFNPTTPVSGLINATGTFRWTIKRGSCSAYDEVDIHAGLSPYTTPISGPNSIVAGVTYTYSVTPQTDASYSWVVLPGATITSNLGNQIQVVFDAGFSGTVSLTIINSYGIAQMHTDIKEAVSTGINNATIQTNKVVVYPTPFSDVVNIEIESVQTELMHVTVMDMAGREILVTDAYQTNELIQFGDDLSDGMYIVQAQFGAEVSVIKIVKQKK
jgi:hypothetical protein